MANDDARDRERAQTEGPVGTRAQDIRSRTDVIAERDAKHLADERGESAPSKGLETNPAPDEAMRTGIERRLKEGTPQALDADGKPYGHDEDPDSYGSKGATVGGIGGQP